MYCEKDSDSEKEKSYVNLLKMSKKDLCGAEELTEVGGEFQIPKNPNGAA